MKWQGAWFRTASILLLFALSIDALTHERFPGNTFIHIHALYLLGKGILLAGCVLLAGRLQPVRLAYRQLATIGARIAAIPAWTFVSVAALLFLAATLLLSWILFHHLPHVTDSQSQYVGAKIIASGHLSLPSEPLRDFFDMQYMINNGRFLSIYPPGHQLLLAVGHLLHAPWLINPLLGTATLVVIYLLGRELGDSATARIAVLLTLSCSFMLYMSSEYMNHATTLFMCTLALLTYVRTLRKKQILSGILCGASIGWAFITRPQTAIPFALPIMLHAIWMLSRDWRSLWRPALSCLAAFLAFAAFLLWYNYQTMGDPLTMTYMVGSPNVERINANLTKIASPELWQSYMDDVRRMLGQTSELQERLFEWPTYSLVFVALLFIFRAGKQYSGLAIACCLTLALSLFINPWVGEIFGPRYLYETSGALIVLTALALRRTPALLRRVAGLHTHPAVLRGGLIALLLVFVAVSIPTRQVALYRLYGHHYYEGNFDFYEGIVSTVQKPALVFLRAQKLEGAAPGNEWYYPEQRYVSSQWPVDTRAPVLFARDLRDRNPELLKQHPDRHVYIADSTGVHPLQADATTAPTAP